MEISRYYCAIHLKSLTIKEDIVSDEIVIETGEESPVQDIPHDDIPEPSHDGLELLSSYNKTLVHKPGCKYHQPTPPEPEVESEPTDETSVGSRSASNETPVATDEPVEHKPGCKYHQPTSPEPEVDSKPTNETPVANGSAENTTPTTSDSTSRSTNGYKTTTTNEYGCTVEYTYDNNNNLLKEVEKNDIGDLVWKKEYKYNSDNKIVESKNTNGANVVIQRDIYEYNEKGQLTQKTTYGLGNSESVVNYSYNKEGYLIKQTDGDKTISYGYDDQGNLTSEVHTNSKDEVTLHYEYRYDSNGNLVSTEDKDANGKTYWSETNSYDENGNFVGSKTYDRAYWEKMNDIPMLNEINLGGKDVINPSLFGSEATLELMFGRGINDNVEIKKTEDGYLIYKDGKEYAEVYDDGDKITVMCYGEGGNLGEFVYDKKDGHQLYGIQQNGNDTIFYEKGVNICTIQNTKDSKIVPNYDAQGNLLNITVENKNGRATYDSNGIAREVEDFANNTVTYCDETGHVTSKQYGDYDVTVIYENGKIVNTKGDVNKIYQAVIDEVYKTNSLGLPVTADNLAFLLENFIHEGNVEEFLEYYKKNNPDGEDFLEALANEIGLGSGNIAKLTDLINGLLAESRKITEIKVQLPKPEEDKPVDGPKEPQEEDLKGDDIETPDWQETPEYPGWTPEDDKDDITPPELPDDEKTYGPVELDEVIITGEAGKGVIMIDGYSFKQMVDMDHDQRYYQVYTPEGDRYTLNEEDYFKYVYGKEGCDLEEILKAHGHRETNNDNPVSTEPEYDGSSTNTGKEPGTDVADNGTENNNQVGSADNDNNVNTNSNTSPTEPELEDVGDEELQGYDWNDEQKGLVTDALKQTFGEDYKYVVTYNFDGSFNYVVYDKNGKVVYNPDDTKPVTLLDLANISDPTKLITYEWTDQEKNEVIKQLSEHFGTQFSYYVTFNFDGTFNYAVFDNKTQTGYFDGVGLGIAEYTLPNGYINVEKLIDDWKENGGQVYSYNETNGLNLAYSSLVNAENTGNYNNFWKSSGYYNDDPFEGIDNFKFMSWVNDDPASYNPGSGGGGEGGSGGGGNGPLDWKNAGLSLMDNLENKPAGHSDVSITDDQDCPEAG